MGLTDDADACLAHATALIEGFRLLPQVTGQENDVGEAVAGKLLQEHVEKAQTRRYLEQRLRRAGGQGPEPGASAADQEQCLPDVHRLIRPGPRLPGKLPARSL